MPSPGMRAHALPSAQAKAVVCLHSYVQHAMRFPLRGLKPALRDTPCASTRERARGAEEEEAKRIGSTATYDFEERRAMVASAGAVNFVDQREEVALAANAQANA